MRARGIEVVVERSARDSVGAQKTCSFCNIVAERGQFGYSIWLVMQLRLAIKIGLARLFE